MSLGGDTCDHLLPEVAVLFDHLLATDSLAGSPVTAKTVLDVAGISTAPSAASTAIGSPTTPL